MCSSDLPTVAVGANLVPLEQSTAADLDLRGTPCGLLLRRANAFRFTAPATGSYTVSTCASGANTRLAVLDGCGASAAPIACNDDYCGQSSSATFTAVAITIPRISRRMMLRSIALCWSASAVVRARLS